MQSNNNSENSSILYNAVIDFYRDANRSVLIFEEESCNEGFLVRFLVDKKYVFEYKICIDREVKIAIPSLAIGPHFFSPGEFWDYENSQRFTLEPTIEGLQKNLKLMDEFIMLSRPNDVPSKRPPHEP